MNMSNEMMCAAEIVAAAVASNATIQGMVADNSERLANGSAIAYDGKAFAEVRQELEAEVQQRKRHWLS